jgi:hypothetical protein
VIRWIGRSLGALRGRVRHAKTGVQIGEAARGCDWCAYGLISGPWTVVIPGDDRDHQVPSFALADTPANSTSTSPD